jgi:putative DNA primase/helicase
MSLGEVEIQVLDPLSTAWLDCSDLGNAQRLIKIAGGRLRWVEDLESWAHYDGRRWSIERGDIEAQLIAHKVVGHIRDEVKALALIAEDEAELLRAFGKWCNPDRAQKRVTDLQTHAVRSGSAGMTSGMLKQARSLLPALLSDFDTDPLTLNCLNRTLRFVRNDDGSWRVEDRPHDPADMLMSIANVEFNPKAQASFWIERLSMLTPDPEQLDAFEPLYGSMLTGLTSDQSFYVHQGKGGDGKSATHMALADLMGDYYRHAGSRTFLQGADRGGAEHRSDLVRLAGDVRFVTCDEPKARSVWDGEVMKQVTGSLITARGSGAKTEITYKPRFKLHVECNNIPRAPSDDKGFRRRFKLFQWKVSLADTPEGEEPIEIILERIVAEKSGVLNWLIAGALRWLETRKIPQPAAMAGVLKDFWADSSPLLEWMSEWCDTSDPNAREAAKTLYDHFKEWCGSAGIEHVMTPTAFGRAMRDKQHAVTKDTHGNRWRLGIRLRDQGVFTDPSDLPSAAPVVSSPRSGAGDQPSGARKTDSGDDELVRP